MNSLSNFIFIKIQNEGIVSEACFKNKLFEYFAVL